MATYGPFYTESRIPAIGFPVSISQQWKYKQDKPYRDIIPYLISRKTGTDFWSLNFTEGYASSELFGGNMASCKSDAYDRFWRGAHKQAQGAMNLLELNKSMLMVANRLKQAADILRSVKDRDASAFLQHVGLSGSPAKILRSASSTWLEATFGWSPIISDVATAVGVLQRDFPFGRCRGGGERSVGVDSFPAISPGQEDRWTSATCVLKARCSGGIRVTNPNLFLANQLGFTNPGLILYDRVPFSFVLDWFLPVNAFLNSFTNDFGCSVEDPLTNISVDARATVELYENPLSGPGSYTLISQDASRNFFFSRSTSIDRPGLFDRGRIPDSSLWLALTSSSLLMQQIGRLRS